MTRPPDRHRSGNRVGRRHAARLILALLPVLLAVAPVAAQLGIPPTSRLIWLGFAENTAPAHGATLTLQSRDGPGGCSFVDGWTLSIDAKTVAQDGLHRIMVSCRPGGARYLYFDLDYAEGSTRWPCEIRGYWPPAKNAVIRIDPDSRSCKVSFGH